MTKWIDIKKQQPKCSEDNIFFGAAYHSVHGIGFAWFWKWEDSSYIIEELEEDFKCKYVCSCKFVKRDWDGDYCIDSEPDDDIMENDPIFKNLGCVTHWMELPELN